MNEKPSFLKKIVNLFSILGPGLITGASDDDPSGIATYSQAGAEFGFATLWTALITFPLMASIQGICARIGIVTSQGLAKTLKAHYPKPFLYLVILLSFPAIILNIGADIQGMGAVTHLLFPVVPSFLFSLFFTLVLLIIIIKYSYQKVALILKWLCLILLSYLIVPFLVKPDWWIVSKSTLIPTIHLNKEFFSILVAILGTTISPYLFFWQATMEAEDRAHQKKKLVVNKMILGNMTADVNWGMFLSNLIMYFIILTAGAVLYKAGIKHIDTVDQAAKALEPLAGRLSYLLFALGVIGTGCLAIPVLAGSLSYMISESFDFRTGLDKKFNEARPFYFTIIISVVIGLGMEFLGVSPIDALLYTAILYGMTAPVMIALVLHIGNNKKIMGEFTNSRLSNFLGFTTLALMSFAAIALIYLQFR
jgi:NRAMP (natural resistance-associated macrophage protein)-like metal ion transporter